MIKQNVQYIRPVITGCIGGLAGAFLVGVLHAVTNLYSSTSRFGEWIIGSGAFRYFLDMAVAFVTAFLLSWILYRWEEKSRGRLQVQSAVKAVSEESVKAEKAWIAGKETTAMEQTEGGVVYSPIQGQVIPMEEVPDDTFAAKVLGDGMAVIPSEGIVYAPFDGKVEKVYDTKHAISISSRDGIEVLIHVGINTEESGGSFFKIFVSDGEWIQKGDQLLQFDIAEMKEAGYSTVTPIVVTNSDDYDVIHLLGNGLVDQQDILMKV